VVAATVISRPNGRPIAIIARIIGWIVIIGVTASYAIIGRRRRFWIYGASGE
jgi:hypothetical protein